jgi:hypothetical protein
MANEASPVRRRREPPQAPASAQLAVRLDKRVLFESGFRVYVSCCVHALCLLALVSGTEPVK